MKTFNDIKNLVDVELDLLSKSVKTLPWSNRLFYSHWLRNTYEYVENSTRILALAGAYLPKNLTQVSNRFIRHSSEESGHELLLVKDLKNLGFSVNDIPVSLEMKMFHQSLYYWLSPVSSSLGIFGFILILEGLAVKEGQWITQQILQSHGSKSANFLRIHSDEDPEHLEKALNILKHVEEKHLNLVGESVLQYARQYSYMLNSIKAHSSDSTRVA